MPGVPAIFSRERFFFAGTRKKTVDAESWGGVSSSPMKLISCLSIICALFVCASCASNYSSPVREEQLTVAKAQREIKIGMSSAEVVEALGSPNMVTTDSERRETWVYDKVSTNISSKSSESGVWLLVFAASGSSARASSNQRTLTIIVKFDGEGKVRDFAYRTSTF